MYGNEFSGLQALNDNWEAANGSDVLFSDLTPLDKFNILLEMNKDATMFHEMPLDYYLFAAPGLKWADTTTIVKTNKSGWYVSNRLLLLYVCINVLCCYAYSYHFYFLCFIINSLIWHLLPSSVILMEVWAWQLTAWGFCDNCNTVNLLMCINIHNNM